MGRAISTWTGDERMARGGERDRSGGGGGTCVRFHGRRQDEMGRGVAPFFLFFLLGVVNRYFLCT
jgi:hypothetical protein